MPFLFGLGADAKKHAKQVHGGYAIKKRLGKGFPKPLRAQKKEKAHTATHRKKAIPKAKRNAKVSHTADKPTRVRYASPKKSPPYG